MKKLGIEYLPVFALSLFALLPGMAAGQAPGGDEWIGAPAPKEEEKPEPAEAVKAEATPASKEEAAAPEGIEALLFDPSNMRLAAGMNGEIGLLRVATAESTSARRVHFGIYGSLFRDDSFVKNSSDAFLGGDFSLGYTPVEFAEWWLRYRNTTNQNNKGSPKLKQTQGDLEVGLKGFYPVLPFLSVGGDFNMNMINGIGKNRIDMKGTIFGLRLISTFDARKLMREALVRVHLNTGFLLGRRSDITDEKLDEIEEFELGVYGYHRFVTGIGLEFPLPYATPFFEYGIEIPLGVKDNSLTESKAAGRFPADKKNVAYPVYHKFTPGIRVTAVPDISALIAVEFGIAPEPLIGVPALPPYLFVFGLAYAFDPLAKEKIVEKEVVKTVEKTVEVVKPPPPTTGKVIGRILDVKTSQPIGGAVLTFIYDKPPEGETEIPRLTPVASDMLDGRFVSYDLAPGALTVRAEHIGYKPSMKPSTVVVGDTALLEFMLEPEIRLGTVSGKTVNLEDKPVIADVLLRGPKQFKFSSSAIDGAFEGKADAGRYDVIVEANGFLSKSRAIDVKEDGKITLDFVLRPKPIQSRVIIEKNKIKIAKKVHFIPGKADLHPDSYDVLDEVVDTLAHNTQIKKVRIEGHTDNAGNKDFNKKLSQQRAETVMNYMATQGIDPERLEAMGFGPEFPIAPNLTFAGKAQNRRVEFTILEQ